MREIVFDTETTGIDPAKGDKIVEIGAVELVNHLPTGRTYQAYLNPERDVPPEAFAVHGLSTEFLSKHPVFAQVYTDFLEFVGDARLVIHNAEFDMKFINAELRAVGAPAIAWARVTDTLALARKKYPGAPASLDALCRRYGIGLEGRTLHGALLDSQLLAEVYLELLGGRQHGLLAPAETRAQKKNTGAAATPKTIRPARPHAASDAEIAAHAALLTKIKNPMWNEFLHNQE